MKNVILVIMYLIYLVNVCRYFLLGLLYKNFYIKMINNKQKGYSIAGSNIIKITVIILKMPPLVIIVNIIRKLGGNQEIHSNNRHNHNRDNIHLIKKAI